MNPAIVISAYNRPRALSRLLHTLINASYPGDGAIPLVISIDHAQANSETAAVAREFSWPFGPKEVLARQEHLGLVQHFYTCGDLTQKYGSTVYLEDDLMVSPVFYFYAAQMLEFYRADERIAGISLYALWFNGYNQQPFVPYPDASDTFFVQVPYTQGEAFTKEQWAGFRSWQACQNVEKQIHGPFHESWSHFDAEDWFPVYAHYMADTGRFFVFPRVSQSTGAGDAGTHFAQETGFFQAPLQQEKIFYQTKPLEDSLAVYDSFFEIHPNRLNRMTGILQAYDYCADLYALRSRANIHTEYVLTSRPCKRPVYSFGKTMWPLEANIVNAIPGNNISFCRTQDVLWSWWADLVAQESNRAYFAHGRVPGIRTWAKSKVARQLIKMKSSFRSKKTDSQGFFKGA